MFDPRYPYWTEQLYEELNRVSSFHELSKIALEALRNTRGNLSQICGPITTGGLLSKEKNLMLFESTIHMLQQEGECVFNQMPIEAGLNVLIPKWRELHGDAYCEPVLNIVFKNIFQSGKIARLYFLRSWQTSRGAVWERCEAQRLGIEIREYPEMWLNHILGNHGLS